MWNKFRQGVEYPKQYGANRDWNIDLIPKFVMANGKNIKKIFFKVFKKRKPCENSFENESIEILSKIN